MAPGQDRIIVRIILNRLSALRRVRRTGRHENHLAAIQTVGLAGNDDLSLPFYHLYERVERCGVFAKTLTFVESEERHTTL